MRNFIIFCLLTLTFVSKVLGSQVFINSNLRPCDPEIAQNWIYTPKAVYAPDSPKLPFRCEGKVKVFELIAEEVFSNFDRNWEAGSVYTWGYNGSNPGPVIEALEGETIKVILTNKLPEPTTVHWHGFELPFNMDGASGHSQRPVMPGKTFEYSWTISQSGTYMYHSGHALAKQLAMGLSGFFVVHPKKRPETMVDQDILLFLQMWTLPPHSILPNTMDMMFNYFTINGKSAPLTTPINVLTGQKVRVRFANISMMQHPIHLHGHTWRVVATGAGDNQSSSHTTGSTVLVPVGQTMDVIIDKIDGPGDWNFHCHLPHHVTNNMDINPVPGEPMMMDDAGMYTLFKVREEGHPDLPSNDSHTGHSKVTPSTNGGGHHMAMGPKPGIYEGKLKLKNGRSFKVMFDIHKVQEDAEWRKLVATLKVILGTSEYLIFHYDPVRFNWKTGELFFNNEKKSLSLNSLKFMKHGEQEMLMGRANVEFTGVEGSVILNYRPNAKSFSSTVNEKKYQTEISGEYFGECNDKETIVSISSARGLSENLVRDGNPFYQYILRGQVATKRSNVFRVESHIENGVYNPFSGVLGLKINSADVLSILTCSYLLNDSGEKILNCNNKCSFKKLESKVSPSIKKERLLFKRNVGIKVSQLSKVKEIGGDFSGRLLHSTTQKVQGIKLKVNARLYSNKPMELATPHVTATLYLDLGNEKNISYKFKERPYLNSTSRFSKEKNSLLLKGDSKLYIIVTHWKINSLDGVLFHDDYGRVGAFQVVRKGSSLKVQFEKGNPEKLTGPSGPWKNSEYDLNLSTIELGEEELEIGNPFYPLHFIGSLESKRTGVLIAIISGNHNFFTGEINLLSNDGRLIKGSINKNGLTLSVPSVNIRRARYLGKSSTIILKK